MELEREKQSLLLEGERYTLKNLHRLKASVKASLKREGAVSKPEEMARTEAMTKPEAENDFSKLALYEFLKEWFSDSSYLSVDTSGSTGKPKKIQVSKAKMMQSARLTCEFLGLKAGDTVLLCMNLRYIGAMMVVVRSLVAGLNLIVRPASGHPLAGVSQPLRFAAMVPLQVYNTLQIPAEKAQLMQTEILIIGGGAIDEALEKVLKSLPTMVYSTYGMTETLSHIALRRLNGASASARYYPFPSVKLSLSSEGTLVIKAPLVCDDVLQTNDMARIYTDGSFTILGRKDNVINSGGIKIQAEEVENRLRPFILSPFVVTSIPDSRWGEAVILLIQGTADIATIEKKMASVLASYYRPKHLFMTDHIPQTENGKIDRSGCRALAKLLAEG